jgi:co-chaperonin GroES (HSP10)
MTTKIDLSAAPTALEIKRQGAIKKKEEDAALDEAILEAQLPRPVGYHLLIRLPDVDEAFDGGILKSKKTIHEEHVLSVVGLVLDMGEQAYNDPTRFTTGPWCKPGDFVMFRANTGTRFVLRGQEYRLMNDDSIQAVVQDPRGISRAG